MNLLGDIILAARKNPSPRDDVPVQPSGNLKAPTDSIDSVLSEDATGDGFE